MTYPTFKRREMMKGVLLRLAVKDGKAVRQLELTDGGDKTLAHSPPRHQAAQASRCCPGLDKPDVEKGMEVLRTSDCRRRKGEVGLPLLLRLKLRKLTEERRVFIPARELLSAGFQEERP